MLDYLPTPDQQPPAATPDQQDQGQLDLSQFLGPPLMEDRPLDPVQRLMNNPLTHIGLGILATPTGQGSWLQGVARGTLAGMQAFQAQQRLNAEIEETLERQRQRASRKELENARIRLAATMPGLSDLERNLLITDPNAFGQIYAAKLQQQQQQQQAAGYRQALGMSGGGAPPQPELGTAPPQGMPGGNYPQQPESGAAPPQTLPPIELPPPDTTGAMPADQAGLDPDLQQLAQTDPKLAYEIWNERRNTAQQQRFQQQQADIAAQREAERNAREEQERIATEGRAKETETPKLEFTQERQLHQDYMQLPPIKHFYTIQSQLSPVPTLFEEGLRNKNPVAQQAMIIATAKAWDPTSVVRTEEGEIIVRTDGIFGVLSKAQGYIKGTGMLSDDKLRNLYDTIKTYYDAARNSAIAEQSRYRDDVVSSYGLKPERVVGRNLNDLPSALPTRQALEKSWKVPVVEPPPPPPGYRTVVNPDGTFSAVPE